MRPNRQAKAYDNAPKPLATRQDLFLRERPWHDGQISGDKGISRQVSLVPLSLANAI
jgi:hypothetical protein